MIAKHRRTHWGRAKSLWLATSGARWFPRAEPVGLPRVELINGWSNTDNDNYNGIRPRPLTDDNVNFSSPENIRCSISGPSECGKTRLLKSLIYK